MNCQEQNIRNVAEGDLDTKMRAILDETGLDPHEKIQKYNALLQRYLKPAETRSKAGKECEGDITDLPQQQDG